MNENIEKRFGEQLRQSTGSGLEDVPEVGLDGVSEQVSEIAGENPAQGGNRGDDDQAVVTDPQADPSIAGRISGLLFSSSPGKDEPLPSVEVQRKRIEKSIKKETKRLLAKARKVQKSRHFSASTLEKIIVEVRHLQNLLKELVTAAVSRVEDMYRHFVLR